MALGVNRQVFQCRGTRANIRRTGIHCHFRTAPNISSTGVLFFSVCTHWVQKIKNQNFPHLFSDTKAIQTSVSPNIGFQLGMLRIEILVKLAQIQFLSATLVNFNRAEEAKEPSGWWLHPRNTRCRRGALGVGWHCKGLAEVWCQKSGSVWELELSLRAEGSNPCGSWLSALDAQKCILIWFSGHRGLFKGRFLRLGRIKSSWTTTLGYNGACIKDICRRRAQTAKGVFPW